MKKRNWLDIEDYARVLGIHLILFILIYLINKNTLRIILLELGNIGISILILILKNLVEESRIKKEARYLSRIEEYKEQIKNNQD